MARNVSAGGIFIESTDPLPLGATVRVRFMTPDDSSEVVASGEVKNHYFMNFVKSGENHRLAGMAVRFHAFEQGGQTALRDCLRKDRVLH